jgi:hypothetical protein
MVEVPATHFTPDHSPDPEQCRAIRKEIGERLRGALADDAEPLPLRLEGLVERLAELDGGAPSIALTAGTRLHPGQSGNFCGV